MGVVLSVEELLEEARRLRAEKRVIAFANGHFDLVHVGHLRYLEAARREGDVLVVGINDDASVASLKGAGRPLIPAVERAELIAALAPVSYAVVFPGDSPAKLIARLEPDVHCKGTDYLRPENVPEFPVVAAYGGRTAIVGDPKDHATSDLIERVLALPRAAGPATPPPQS